MKRAWHILRTTVAHPDGQRRWDRAYQLLLRWADDATAPSQPLTPQEDDHAHCPVQSANPRPLGNEPEVALAADWPRDQLGSHPA
jgi:hypothetical protein